MKTRRLEKTEFIREKVYGDKKSALARYKELVIGERSLWELFKYEVITSLLGPVPGALGLFLRKMIYPRLFARIGRNVVFGRNVTLRHPDKIGIGDAVIIDDDSLIDARGAGEEKILIGERSIISRGSTIQAKSGCIHIGVEANVGARCAIVAQGGVHIGKWVNLAGGCVISGGAYKLEREEGSRREHDKVTKGPIRIDDKCRLGMNAMVLDGVHIGEGTVVGALSMVNSDLPSYCVAAGIPAKVIGKRE